MGNRTQVPDGWRSVRLEQIAEERRVRANSDPQAEVFSVTKHDGFVRSLEYFDRQVFSRDTSNYKVVRRGDLAYATIHLDEGSLGILRDADAALISPMYTVFSVDKTQVDPNYLFALMKLPQMVSRYGRIGEGTVHRRKSISFKRLGRLAFEIPPVDEQRRIMDVLDAIDEAIERTEAVISATECLRDALLHELLTRGVPGWHTQWRTVPGLGTIPADWQIVRLKEISDRITKGTTPTSLGHEYVPSGVRFLRVENIGDTEVAGGDMRFITHDTHQMLSRSILQAGDILLSIAGALGRSALITSDHLPANVNQALSIVRLAKDQPAIPEFIVLMLCGHMVQKQVEDMRSELAQANINLEQVGSLAVALPSLCEQRAIAKIIAGARGAIEMAFKERSAVQSLQASMADALLTGRVRAAGRAACV